MALFVSPRSPGVPGERRKACNSMAAVNEVGKSGDILGNGLLVEQTMHGGLGFVLSSR